jgi:hypothetical protein
MSNVAVTQQARRTLLLAVFVLAMLGRASVDGGTAELQRTVDALGGACILAAAGWLLLAARAECSRRRMRDEAILQGAWDRADTRTCRRAARLVSCRTRRQLARGLRAAATECDRAPTPYSFRTSGSAVCDPDARAACLALADALGCTEDADPWIVLRVERLLCDGDSPLAGACGRRLTEDASGLARGLVLQRNTGPERRLSRAG